SKTLSLITSLADVVAAGPPLTRAPARGKPGRTGPVLSLPPMAWVWLEVLPLTGGARVLLAGPPAAGACGLAGCWVPARAPFAVNELSVTVAVANPVMPFTRAPPLALPAEVPLLPSAPNARLLMKEQLEMVSVAVPRFARAPPRAPPGRPVGLLLASPIAWLL